MSNAERCRRYRQNRHDRDMMRDMMRDMFRDMFRDMLPEIVQGVTDALRHGADMACRDMVTPNGPPLKKSRTKEITPPLNPPQEERARATRLPADFVMPMEWIEDGASSRRQHNLPAIDLDLEADLFCNYWWSRGRDGAKLDWRRTWLNWCLNAKGNPANGHAKRQSPADKLFEGAYRAAEAFAARHGLDD